MDVGFVLFSGRQSTLTVDWEMLSRFWKIGNHRADSISPLGTEQWGSLVKQTAKWNYEWRVQCLSTSLSFDDYDSQFTGMLMCWMVEIRDVTMSITFWSIFNFFFVLIDYATTSFFFSNFLYEKYFTWLYWQLWDFQLYNSVKARCRQSREKSPAFRTVNVGRMLISE